MRYWGNILHYFRERSPYYRDMRRCEKQKRLSPFCWTFSCLYVIWLIVFSLGICSLKITVQGVKKQLGGDCPESLNSLCTLLGLCITCCNSWKHPSQYTGTLFQVLMFSLQGWLFVSAMVLCGGNTEFSN